LTIIHFALGTIIKNARPKREGDVTVMLPMQQANCKEEKEKEEGEINAH